MTLIQAYVQKRVGGRVSVRHHVVVPPVLLDTYGELLRLNREGRKVAQQLVQLSFGAQQGIQRP